MAFKSVSEPELDRAGNLTDTLEQLHRFLDAYFHLVNTSMVEDGTGLIMVRNEAKLQEALRPLLGSGAEDAKLEDYTPTRLLQLLNAATQSAKVSEAFTQLRDTTDELRIAARFVPQAYVKGDAVEIDTDFDVEVDVTEDILRLPLEVIMAIEDNTEDADRLVMEANDTSDGIRAHAELYPYRVEVEDSINDFFQHHVGCDRYEATYAQLVVLRGKYGIS